MSLARARYLVALNWIGAFQNAMQRISDSIEMQTQTAENNNNHIIDYLLNGISFA